MIMNILIIDIDSKITNYALAKVAKYHSDKGDAVTWNMPLMRYDADKIYVSCVFTKNKYLCKEWVGDAIIGGSGYDLSVKLPDEIESIKPRINMGFTTRGCIRNCSFCIVPEKEGRVHVVGDLLDLWDGKTKDITLMDNNVLALPEHFKMVCQQARDNKLRLDFNQGLDHRLLSDDLCGELASISHKEYKFSFDHPSMYDSVDRAIRMLHKQGIKRSTWYVLVGYDTTYDEDIARLEHLKTNGQRVFVQRYETCYHKKEYIQMARWANQHHMFNKMTFDKFLSTVQGRIF